METILIIDDNDSDFELIRQGMEEAGARQRLHRAHNFAEAEAFLEHHRPHLILFDPSLRGEHGLDLIRRLKQQRRLLICPIIVFTISDDPGDVQEALRAGANAYVRKPLHLEAFLRAVHHIAEFWLDIALTALSARPPRMPRRSSDLDATLERRDDAGQESESLP